MSELERITAEIRQFGEYMSTAGGLMNAKAGEAAIRWANDLAALAGAEPVGCPGCNTVGDTFACMRCGAQSTITHAPAKAREDGLMVAEIVQFGDGRTGLDWPKGIMAAYALPLGTKLFARLPSAALATFAEGE